MSSLGKTMTTTALAMTSVLTTMLQMKNFKPTEDLLAAYRSLESFEIQCSPKLKQKKKKKVLRKIHMGIAAERLLEVPEYLKNHLTELSSNSAYSFLNSVPMKHTTRSEINDSQMNAIIRNSLMIPHNSHHEDSSLPKYCRCDAASPSGLQPFTIHHPHGCKFLKPKEVSARHNAVARSLGEDARRAGMHVTLEPRVFAPNATSQKRADILLQPYTSDKKYSGDVSIIHTSMPTYEKVPVKQQLENRAKAKVAKHGQYQAECGHEFSGLAITSNGMVGKEVIELVKIIAQHAVNTNRAFSAKAFARETMYNLVCALQLGNVA